MHVPLLHGKRDGAEVATNLYNRIDEKVDHSDTQEGADCINAQVPRQNDRGLRMLQKASREVVAFLVLIMAGIVMGLALPRNKELRNEGYATLSNILGWIYFLAWTVSFYPQIFLNWRQRNTEGLSLGFELLNLLGFLFYSVYALSFFLLPQIQEAYRKRHNGHENKVTIQDVVFACHATILTALTVAQMLHYDGIRIYRRLSWPIFMVLTGLLVITCVALVVVSARGDGPSDWLLYLYTISFMKLFVSVIKGVPQAFLNYRRKSTVGWSIHNVLCDFTGTQEIMTG